MTPLEWDLVMGYAELAETRGEEFEHLRGFIWAAEGLKELLARAEHAEVARDAHLRAVVNLTDRVESAEAQRDAAIAALKAVEWGWHHARCPCCNRPKAELGHYPDCVLAAALGYAVPRLQDAWNTKRP